MLRSRFAVLVLLTFVLCPLLVKGQSISYEEGLERCDQIREHLKASNSKALAFLRPDCMEGARVPEFKTTTIEGRTIADADLEGRVSVLNFWFVACQPCIAEIPGFQLLTEMFDNKEVNFIAIGREEVGTVEEFLGDHKWEFEHIASEYLTNDVFRIQWGFPTTFVLNKNAEIIYASSGGYTDERAVQEVIEKLPPVIRSALEE